MEELIVLENLHKDTTSTHAKKWFNILGGKITDTKVEDLKSRLVKYNILILNWRKRRSPVTSFSLKLDSSKTTTKLCDPLKIMRQYFIQLFFLVDSLSMKYYVYDTNVFEPFQDLLATHVLLRLYCIARKLKLLWKPVTNFELTSQDFLFLIPLYLPFIQFIFSSS